MQNFTPALMMIVNNNHLSYGGKIDFDFSDNIKISIENLSKYKFYDINIIYDDFQFDLYIKDPIYLYNYLQNWYHKVLKK